MLSSVTRVTIALSIAFGVALPAAKAETIQCRASPEAREYWSWREIDGRRCWYKGRRSISKKLLSWDAKTPEETIETPPSTNESDPTPAAKLPPTSSGAPAERVEVIERPAPAIAQSGKFETDWQNSMTDLQSHDRAKAVRTIPVGPAPAN
ncbi:MAG: hypothetical protein U1E81_05165 [Xanthobacteraceae bacterium]